MTTSTLPAPVQLRRLLTSLLGKDVTITRGARFDLDALRFDPYVGDDNVVRYVVGSSKEFAAFSGAALAMLPSGRAEAAINQGGDEMLDMAYYEVLNVLTRAINDLGGMHVRLPVGEDTVTPELSPDASAAFTASIADYGDGSLMFWAL